MKQGKAIVQVFNLNEKMLENVEAFKGRNIEKLSPAVIVIDAKEMKEHRLVIMIEVYGCIPQIEFDCPWNVIKDMPGFRESDNLEDFIDYMVSEDILDWETLLKEYDRFN